MIGGDGIGPEVIEAAIPVIDRAAAYDEIEIQWERFPLGADHYLATGESLPETVLEELRNGFDAILLGALGDPRVPTNEHARDILLGLRFRLDLYVNFRPCRLLDPTLSPLRAVEELSEDRTIDFVIFRENTEGSYLGRGTSRNEGEEGEERVSEEVNTAPKVERILRAAFAWARDHGRSRVTMSDKSNAIPAHQLWQRLFDRVGSEFPDVQREHRYIDALTMELIRNPARFDVIVTNNLFGDILSDLGAEIVGGIGLAASANLHPGRPGLFEPVHGSAPAIAGKGRANPVAAIRTGALMLHELGAARGSQRVEHAVRAALVEGIRTPEIGGDKSTTQVAEWIANKL